MVASGTKWPPSFRCVWSGSGAGSRSSSFVSVPPASAPKRWEDRSAGSGRPPRRSQGPQLRPQHVRLSDRVGREDEPGAFHALGAGRRPQPQDHDQRRGDRDCAARADSTADADERCELRLTGLRPKCPRLPPETVTATWARTVVREGTRFMVRPSVDCPAYGASGSRPWLVAEAVPPEAGQESGWGAKPALRRVRLRDDGRRAGTGYLPTLPEPLAPGVGERARLRAALYLTPRSR